MADRLLDKISPPIRRVDRIKYPGGEHEIGILQLVCSEIMDAEVDAREHVAKRGVDLKAAHADILRERELDVQLVFRMVVDPESKGQPEHRIFKTADEARQRLSPDQRTYLIDWHLHHQTEMMTSWSWPQKEELK